MQNSNRKVAILELIIALIGIISGIAQVMSLGFQVADYIDQPQPSSVEIVQREAQTKSEVRK